MVVEIGLSKELSHDSQGLYSSIIQNLSLYDALEIIRILKNVHQNMNVFKRQRPTDIPNPNDKHIPKSYAFGCSTILNLFVGLKKKQFYTAEHCLFHRPNLKIQNGPASKCMIIWNNQVLHLNAALSSNGLEHSGFEAACIHNLGNCKEGALQPETFSA